MGLFKPAMSDKEEDVEEFEQVGSGASLTVPIMAGNIKKGSFVVIKNRPCKVIETSTSKTGKHGHAKVHMVALDIFTNAKKEDICPSSHNMTSPVVNRADYQLLSIDDEGFCSLIWTTAALRMISNARITRSVLVSKRWLTRRRSSSSLWCRPWERSTSCRTRRR